ncbi:glycosyltransferase family 4 protein [Pseudoalteromonas rubra]|uniref:glycosyltransferase family 4 protein n=1 Tax=Pseudoalteromonas rubra TaxID=43658 RepID=UPI000F79FAB4|nr:glycosyltransferase family 4 protein [Pseudoalteromonas rubra]
MKKILYIVSALSKCGPTNQLLNIIKNLDEKAFYAEVLTLSPEPNSSMIDEFELKGIKVHSLGLSRLAGFFYAKKLVNRFIENFSPDVIHTQGYRADLISSTLVVDSKRVCTIRNFPQIDFKMEYGSIVGNLMAFRHFRAMSSIDSIVGVSKPVVDNIKKNTKTKNLLVIENGVDTERFKSVPSSESLLLRTELGLKERDVVFLSSGGLIERKDPEFLVRFFKKQPDNYHLLLVGDGELKSKLHSLASGKKNIHIVGAVNDVNLYLNVADYYISASRAEGLPNAVMEAMATGLPVILSDIGPHCEVVKYGTDCASLFELDNEESLQSSVDATLEADYVSASHSSLAIVNDFLNAKNMSLKYQELYQIK